LPIANFRVPIEKATAATVNGMAMIELAISKRQIGNWQSAIENE